MSDQASTDEQKKISALERKIRCAREALGEGEELPRLLYNGDEITDEGDEIVVPLATSRAPGRLRMSPAVATDLIERIGSILAPRRFTAAAKVRESHVRCVQDDRYDTGYCEQDGEGWPCSTIVALQGEGPE